MPLLDHFQPPLYPQRSFESFHSRWANSIADALHAVLSQRYFVDVHIHRGIKVEAEVTEFEQATGKGSGGVATQAWAPPTATFVLPTVFPDEVEIHVRDRYDDAGLVATVELVSPRNKDRPDSRHAYAGKCAAYLQRGVSLIMVDIVTSRGGNMHNELMALLEASSSYVLPPEVELYAVAFRPVRRGDADQIDVWPTTLSVGAALPVLPLGLRGDGIVPVDLEATYGEARRRSKF